MNNRSFADKCYSVKKRFLEMYRKANAGHIGCSLSCTEMLVFLKMFWMREKDNLILSKGHAAAALYSTLAESGDIEESAIRTFYKDGTYLGAHPPAGRLKGIPFATGSLGHGLSVSAGMALASRMKNEDRRFFCITSDGELNEGSIWEAVLFSSHRKLDNLIWLIDRNRIQGFGRTEEVMCLEPLRKKLESFDLAVFEADGHDYKSLCEARDRTAGKKGAPKAIICNTVKGHGISFMEDTVDWHYLPMSEENYLRAVEELDRKYNEEK